MKSSWHLLSDGENGSFLERLLKNRGIGGAETEGFIKPPFPDLGFANASLGWKGSELTGALDLIRRAIADNRPIIIHGDYDVDGIVATAILWRTIYQDLGYRNCRPFMPNRFEHGYGLSRSSIDSIRGPLTRGPLLEIGREGGLLITVDCGITAKEEVEYAKNQGFDVLIIDHHSPPSILPDCTVIWSDLMCAGALSWVVSQSLSDAAANYLDLAAMATVADLQPLLGFNRSLTKFGLEGLSSTKNIGLRALKKISGIEGKKIGTFEIGWILAPRLNASGRLENALESLRLLCTKSEKQALEIAEKLNSLNLERQELTKASVDLALSITQGESLSKINVAVHEDFHEGIIGLVAGKLVSHLGTPAVVISKGDELSKASARSVEGFNIVEFLRSLGPLFENIGGHAGAAGFTIRTERIEDFLRTLNSYQEGLEIPSPLLKIEGELKFEEINYDLLELLKKLAPFGIGNSEPSFLSRKVPVQNASLAGNGKSHLKLSLGVNGKLHSAIFFGKGDLYKDLVVGDLIDIVYNLSEDNWNGRRSISLKIRDLDVLN